jgi:L-2-hydroxyglutarate oxidase LhgO
VKERIDAVVVGGGIVGLATARALQQSRRGVEVVLLEKEHHLGEHQTGHNSGVLHSGLYYRPGSLKARLCVEGRRRTLDFCRQEGLEARVTGKLVLATRRREVPGLEELHRRGEANGLSGMERLGPSGIADHEPQAAGVAALWVPETGVVDFAAIAVRMGERFGAAGGTVRLGREVDRIELGGRGAVVGSGDEAFDTRVVVNAAGLHADRLARLAGSEPPVRIVPFRGEYHLLDRRAAAMINGLVYPVPDPRFPFLGVHFTRRLDGSVEVGPNAVLALGREQYRGDPPDWAELRSVLGFGGFRRLALRHLVPGISEMIASRSRAVYARRARRLVPGIRAADLLPGGSGVRAQAVFPDGSLADDFVISGDGPMLHVLSAPSPAATAAPAIGAHLAAIALDRIE